MNIIEKYYQVQRSKGYSFGQATLLIPQKMVTQIKHVMFGYPDVMTGFGFFKLPLLASYSRSGTNWIRYTIETLSGLATPGQRRKVHSDKYIIDRAHKAYEVMGKYPSVMLVLRDYRECLIRHNKDVWKQHPDVKTFLEITDIEQPANWYIKNIEAFDKFEGKKLLLYYEDLMAEPESSIRSIAQFLEIDESKVDDFLANIDEHRKKSVNAYTSGGHDSFTGSSRSLNHHAKSNLRPEQITEFDEYYFTNFPELAQKYLARYDKRTLEQAN